MLTNPTYEEILEKHQNGFINWLLQSFRNIQKFYISPIIYGKKKLLYCELYNKYIYTKYPQHHNNNPDEIVNWAIYCSVNGDSKFLDDKLEQLRSLDSLASIKF